MGSPLPPHPLRPVPAPSAVVAPQDLQLLKSTAESLLVSWTPASEVDHYLLGYHPRGAELSAKQVRVPGQVHSYDIPGLLPGTAYVVTLRSVKKEVFSSPQHLLATTGEAAARCPRFSRTGPVLNIFFLRPHDRPSTSQAVVPIWG